LITHTSGIPNNDLNDFNKGLCVPYTTDELIATFRSRPLKFEPGTKWAYTNTEYYLLAYIIESVSGETYGDFLTHHVFQPLAMNASGFAPTLAIIPQMAEGYARDGKSLRHWDYFDRSLEIGAGGVYSTVSDMLRWNEALNAEKLLNRKSLDLMFTPSSPLLEITDSDGSSRNNPEARHITRARTPDSRLSKFVTPSKTCS
jgi:CubicO group peptidase (beta-lactamase class C family)